MAHINYRPLNSRPFTIYKISEGGPRAASSEPSVDLPVDGKGEKRELPSRHGEEKDLTRPHLIQNQSLSPQCCIIWQQCDISRTSRKRQSSMDGLKTMPRNADV